MRLQRLMHEPKPGLLHLLPVPKFVNGVTDPFARFLQSCIRSAADRQGGRDIPLEDFYHECLSYADLGPSLRIVRFSNIAYNGQAFGNMSTLATLEQITVIALRAKYMTLGAQSPGYKKYYGPKVIERLAAKYPDFLFVPDNKNCKTYVVLQRE